ncbi:Transglycosylase SLT domain-containing protein [Bradyrhizobium yuanmingense]|uniref:Transglycosylase SLT domain-containing protein n=1 Tax=Bradyrhizobium yuanmingense TaxID=108015 RepID=A0A1C3XKE8_9BRAD|nr:transglycosylase SLT domain-containing protein [Bradyrhizobium yuanmingense]TWI18997.1 transglycosylase-like protein with SLT domain [Bradyrhizobium yuanmingense]SCB52730.1 Transglycosylase SLT domain-containing protein [Bradyrhizobium yuanmingense]
MGLVDSIIGVESGGNPNATNPRSSASGLGQFIDSTWLATIRQAKPDLAGKTDAELLALKTDPQLSREMTEAYANQNQAILSKAGVPVTPGTTYLAHFAGPGGAVKVLQADPNAMAGDVLGAAVVKANPFLANMTARDLQAWADRKMGGSSPQPQPAQAAPAAPASGLLAQAPQSPTGLAPPQAGGLLQAPTFPQAPQQTGGGLFAQMPAEQAMQAPPIQFVQRRPVNLAGLRNALQQRAPIFSRG